MISTHTLTWSVTSEESDKREREKDFNSHAHVERDNVDTQLSFGASISTHTLTWSVTTFRFILFKPFVISTHTLTWSVTYSSFK